MIRFFFNDTFIQLSNRRHLKKFIKHIFKEEGVELASLNYVFCSDQALLSINIEFLSHNNFTDIITFNLAEEACPIVGEIYISVDRVKENAIKFGSTISTELHRVMFHGALHLCGYGDKAKKDKLTMRTAENKYLSLYKL